MFRGQVDRERERDRMIWGFPKKLGVPFWGPP